MRIVGISCVKDELDIIEPFVRHTLALVDHLVIQDNGSSDGTREVLRDLVHEGLPLEITDDPSVGFYQRQRMTMLMRDHALEKHSADWIVPLDADEFLAGEPVRSTLQAHSPTRPLDLEWRTYVPHSVDDVGEPNPVLRIRHRLHREARRTKKVAIPAVLASEPGVEIDQGSHHLLRDGEPIAPTVQNQTFLAHFPGRSIDQFSAKIAKNHIQFAATKNRDPSWGIHYQTAWDLLRRSPREFAGACQNLILRFNLRDDVPFNPELVLDAMEYLGGDLRQTPIDFEPHIILIRTLMDLNVQLNQSRKEEAARFDQEVQEQVAMIQGQLPSEISRLTSAVNQQSATIQHQAAAIDALQLDAAELRRSWSWRIGCAALTPVRSFKRMIGRAA